MVWAADVARVPCSSPILVLRTSLGGLRVRINPIVAGTEAQFHREIDWRRSCLRRSLFCRTVDYAREVDCFREFECEEDELCLSALNCASIACPTVPCPPPALLPLACPPAPLLPLVLAPPDCACDGSRESCWCGPRPLLPLPYYGLRPLGGLIYRILYILARKGLLARMRTFEWQVQHGHIPESVDRYGRNLDIHA